jgi:hypothetical protein
MKLLRALLVLLALALAPAAALAATNSSQTAAEKYVLEEGIMTMKPDGEFHGEARVSRIELVLLTVGPLYSDFSLHQCFDNIASEPPARFTLLFRDVPRDIWFGRELCQAMFVGLVNGKSNAMFDPYETITFAEASKIITKAYGIAPAPSLNPDPRVPWFEPYRGALAQKKGIPSSIKRMDQAVTREQVAQILYALRNDRPDLGFVYPGQGARPIQKSPSVKEKSIVSAPNKTNEPATAAFSSGLQEGLKSIRQAVNTSGPNSKGALTLEESSGSPVINYHSRLPGVQVPRSRPPHRRS